LGEITGVGRAPVIRGRKTRSPSSSAHGVEAALLISSKSIFWVSENTSSRCEFRIPLRVRSSRVEKEQKYSWRLLSIAALEAGSEPGAFVSLEWGEPRYGSECDTRLVIDV
jgi:hypothetical protein